MPANATRAAPGTGTARHVQAAAKQTGALTAATVPDRVPSLAELTAECNRMLAEERDRECRCPGRAYVTHAWDLDAHRGECPAGYAWMSAAEVADALDGLGAVVSVLPPAGCWGAS